MRKKYILANWKMNQNLNDIETFFNELTNDYDSNSVYAGISPQSLHLEKLVKLSENHGKINIGSQNTSSEKSGAYTGEISPIAVKEMGINFTLIGHSERRAIFGEQDVILNKKTLLALQTNLKVIFCVGETLEEREAGSLESVLRTQLSIGLKDIPADQKENIVIAYEPVWAIGTGKVAGPTEAQEAHALIRVILKEADILPSQDVSILYGGSVKPSNVEGLLSENDIDGALVGGASLKASDFNQLILAANK